MKTKSAMIASAGFQSRALLQTGEFTQEASDYRGERTNAQPDLWRSVMMSRRRRSPWRRSGVAR
jgi:hypothetical protein